MQQEVYLAKKQVFDQLKAQQYTAEASLDIMHDPQNRLTTRPPGVSRANSRA